MSVVLGITREVTDEGLGDVADMPVRWGACHWFPGSARTPHLLARTRREPFDSPGSPFDLTTRLTRCANSAWIFGICVVSTTSPYSFGVAVELAPFALR